MGGGNHVTAISAQRDRYGIGINLEGWRKGRMGMRMAKSHMFFSFGKL